MPGSARQDPLPDCAQERGGFRTTYRRPSGRSSIDYPEEISPYRLGRTPGPRLPDRHETLPELRERNFQAHRRDPGNFRDQEDPHPSQASRQTA